MEIDFSKYNIVPRLRPREWNGAPFGLWAEIFPKEVPNSPIVAFGLDNPSTVIFPEKTVFTAAGYTPEVIMDKAIDFLRDQHPTWERIDIHDDSLDNLDSPPLLGYYHEYGAEQILNKDFLAQACKTLGTSLIFVGAMTQKSILVTPSTKNNNSVYQFIVLQLFKYAQNPNERITPGIFIADHEGNLVGGLGYDKSIYDSIMKEVESQDDSKLSLATIQRGKEQTLQILAYGSNPKLLFSHIWTTMVVAGNQIGKANKNSKLLGVELVLVTDKMPPIELFETEIQDLKVKVLGSSKDMEELGTGGMFKLNILYKKSTDLIL